MSKKQLPPDIIEPARGGRLGWRKIKGCVVPYSAELGVGQYFSEIVRNRIHKQKPCNIIFTGEAGSSKSYSAIAFARYIDPSFSIKNIVMTHPEFMLAMTTFKAVSYTHLTLPTILLV